MTTLTKAALLAVLAALVFNIETTLVKSLTGVPLATLVLTRAAGQFLWTLPLLIRDPTLPRTRAVPMQLFRGLLSVMSWYGYYFGFAHLPLATATVLSFTSVLFVTALATPLLGERVGWRRWTATLVGFLGVVAIVRPGAVEVGWPVAASIVSALIGAAIVLTTKTLARTERTSTIMFWVGLVSLSVALPVAAPGLAWPGWHDAGLLLLIAITGPCAMQIWISALRMADASVVAPLSYVRLIFAAGFGMVLFGEVPDLWLALGAALIVGSALYITRREALVARRRAAPLAANPLTPAVIRPRPRDAAGAAPGTDPSNPTPR
jgi:drug/metabolite transporter (DMT)-like permease